MAVSRLCSIEGCGKPVRSVGLCSPHYYRRLRHGDPTGGQRPREEAIRWLKDHVSHEGEDCLIWPFTDDGRGYGKVGFEGKRHKAHRLMCVFAHGEPPEPSYQSAHSCGRGDEGCVNPRHLRWATQAENQADRVEHGTSNRGARHGMSKLTADDVRAIRAMEGQKTLAAIGRDFGIGAPQVCEIIGRKTWAWLE